MILLIDNYDSFSYNLFQLIGEINSDIKVVRNDKISCKEIEKFSPEKIILSPGPGRPENAGIILEVVKKFFDKIPILGVCLGHQAICQAFGAKITYAKKLMHGKQSEIICDNTSKIFKNLPVRFSAARYHSLVAETSTMPEVLKIVARSLDDNEIMAVQHKDFPIYGVQFHPESIMTQQGNILMKNFLEV